MYLIGYENGRPAVMHTPHQNLKPVAKEQAAAQLPFRSPVAPDFDRLSFDVYQTARMYLACHVTSDAADVSLQWPNSCFEVGWENYYAEDHDEKDWRAVFAAPIVPMQNLSFHPATCALHYGAAAFEGTKAFYSAKGKIVLFRPDMNARRFQKTTARLLMPKVPMNMFVDSVRQTVLANREFIPPYRRENWIWETRNPRCLYVRPFIVGHGPQIGVRPPLDHSYLVYTTPVQALYPVEGIRVLVSSSIHRASPGGIGNTKAAANYVGGFFATQLAKRGCAWLENKAVKVSDTPFHDVLYLDAVHNEFVEEFSGANFFAVTRQGILVTPESDSILPGITRESIITLAAELGLKVERRALSIEEVMNAAQISEAFCTGNAAVITPIVSIQHDGRLRTFEASENRTARRLWDLLVGIQLQTREDPFGWVMEID
jgi:branched-chain amino acid aminotransferase